MVIGNMVKRLASLWAIQSLRTKGLVVVALPLSILLVSIGTLLFVERQEQAAQNLLSTAFQVEGDIQKVHTLVAEASTAVRGYLLTNDRAYLAPYQRAVRELPGTLARLDSNIVNDAQRDNLRRLRPLAQAQLSSLQQLSQAAASAGSALPPPQRARLDQSKLALDELRSLINVMQAHEAEVLNNRSQRADAARSQELILSAVTGIVGLLGSMLAVGLFSSGIVRQVQRLEKNAHRLEQGRPLLPIMSADDEIGRAGYALQAASSLLMQRENALREAQAFLEHIIASGPVWIFRYTFDNWTCTYVSQNVTHLLGYLPSEIMGVVHFLLDHVHPDDRVRVTVELQRLINQGQLTHEYRFQHKDGGYHWLHSVMQLQHDQHGQPSSVLGYALDITERKAADLALRESEERLRLVVDGAKDYAIYMLDPRGHIASWNSGAQRIEGYAADEALDAHISRFYVPEERARGKPEQDLAIALRDGWVEDEGWRVRQDGSRFWANMVITALYDEHGRLRGFSKVTRDVTERKRAEEVLRQKSAFVQLLQQVAAAANSATTLHEAFQTVLNQVCIYMHWPVAHAYMVSNNGSPALEPPTIWYARHAEPFRPLHVLEASDDTRNPAAVLSRVLHTGQPAWSLNIAHPPASSRMRLAHAAGLHAQLAFPVKIDGAVVAVLEFFSRSALAPDAVVSDLMSYINVQLGRVIEREQTERDLRQVQESAERANQAKSDFLGRMSHELRTPLNAILGFAQLLDMDSGMTAKQQQRIAHILKAGRHLLELINEVLDITRIEAGKLALTIQPVLLRDVMQEALDLMQPLAVQQQLRLEHQLPPASLAVLADRQRLMQVLLNVLANALKYNRAGGQVRIAYTADAERLRISVSDTGSGIPQALIGQLFTPFERLLAEETGVEGTGLGLALSKRLIEAMRGAIGVESTVGAGSTFWIELPLALDAAPMIEQAGVHEAPLVDELIHPFTILYIEDNLSNLTLVEALLSQREEIKLIPAMQGRLGLTLAYEHHPDLILLDLHLPDVPGDEVLRRLREAPATRDIPVLILSADATSGRSEQLIAAGAYAYITKPLDIQQFLSIINQLLVEGAH